MTHAPHRSVPGSTPGATGPLAGIRVLEMGSTVAGPFCGRLLADFGAEVVKIEDPAGDPVRTMGKRFHGKSLYAASIFRNKALMALDLRQTPGREVARELALKADVLIENFRPGSLESWGLGYDVLSERNPGLIMVRISGFGQDGPYSQRAGYGVISEALSGLRHLTGDPDRPPARVAVSMTDYITGLYAAFGTTMAVLSRMRTGQGQVVDAALYESAFSFMEPWIPAYDKMGFVANRCGSRLPESTPNNLYATADGQFIHITAMGDAVFRRLAGAMGQPQLAHDERFAQATARSANVEALDDVIAQWTRSHPLSHLEQVLEAAVVPAMRIFTIADIFADPHYRARGTIVRAPDADLGDVAMAQVVPRLSQTPGAVRHAGHRVGEDSRQVLQQWLNMPEAAIDSLVEAKVLLDRATAGQGGSP